MSENEKEAALSRLCGMLGLCRRAGKTVLGTAMVCEALRQKEKPALVLMSYAASAATQKRLSSKCAFYRVPLATVPAEGERLAAVLGKSAPLVCVAVTDEALASAVRNKLAALPGAFISIGKETSR